MIKSQEYGPIDPLASPYHAPEITLLLRENKLLFSSWLYKRSHKTHQWQKRWVVLRNCQLSYYKDSSEYKARKVVNRSQLLSYSPILDNTKFHFAVYTNNRVVHWKCDDASTYNQWMYALEAFFQHQTSPVGWYPDYKSEDEMPETPSTPPRNNLSPHPRLTKSFSDNAFTFPTSPRHLSCPENNSKLSVVTAILDKNQRSKFLRPLPVQDNGSDLTRNDSLSPVPKILENGIEIDSPIDTSPVDASDDYEFLVEQGHLWRLRKRYNQWKRYYVTLTNKKMYFYKNKLDFGNPSGTFSLDDFIDAIELDPIAKTKNHCFMIITPLERIRFCADSNRDLSIWVSSLNSLARKRKWSY